MANAGGQASDFGEVRPSASDIRRHVENLRDRAVEKGYGEHFSIKRVRSRSVNSQKRDSKFLDRPSRCGSSIDDALDLKQEDDLEDCTTLDIAKSPKGPPKCSSQEVY